MEYFERGRNITLHSIIIQFLAVLPIIQHTVFQFVVEVVGDREWNALCEA